MRLSIGRVDGAIEVRWRPRTPPKHPEGLPGALLAASRMVAEDDIEARVRVLKATDQFVVNVTRRLKTGVAWVATTFSGVLMDDLEVSEAHRREFSTAFERLEARRASKRG